LKRLLKISLDTLLGSVFPIITWLVLSIILDKNLINVFGLTFPLQFVGWVMGVIFGAGANIHKERDGNKNAVMSGLFLGSAVGLIVFGFLIFNVDLYLVFMNVEVEIYREFTIYAMLQMYISMIFGCILDKLYFEGKNSKANKYSLLYNIISFSSVVLFALILDNKLHIVILASLVRAGCAVLIGTRVFEKFKLKINILKYIKYISHTVVRLLMLFIVFLIGYKNAFAFGEEYIIGLTFIGLITDVQWDIIITAISAAAEIDLAKRRFNYREHLKNGYKLCALVVTSILILAVCLWNFYDIPAAFVVVIIILDIYALLLYPLCGINSCFLQLEYSAKKNTANQFVMSLMRIVCAFFRTPYNSTIGQIIGTTYILLSTTIMLKRNFVLDESGELLRR